jgi:hypothetical protein
MNKFFLEIFDPNGIVYNKIKFAEGWDNEHYPWTLPESQ